MLKNNKNYWVWNKKGNIEIIIKSKIDENLFINEK